MKSDLPKVLHTVHGRPMVLRCVDALRAAGIDDIVIVVGYRADLVRETVGDGFRFATQTEQLGTGHAVLAAAEHLEHHAGRTVVVYGDAPLQSPRTLRRLADATANPGVAGALLSIEVDSPPAAGRIIRDASGAFVNIIEQVDCTPEQRAIREVNVGQYCFHSQSLLTALRSLRPDNAQGEYYLTDVPAALAAAGHGVEVVSTDDLLETLGVNDRRALAFAESVVDIRYAESLYPLIDATLAMQRTG